MLLIQFVDPLARTAIDFQVSLSGLIDALMLHLKLLITWRCHRVIDRWNEAISMQSFNLAGYLNKNWALINFYSIKARVWCINSIRGGGGVGGSNERWQSDTNWRRRGEKNEFYPLVCFYIHFKKRIYWNPAELGRCCVLMVESANIWWTGRYIEVDQYQFRWVGCYKFVKFWWLETSVGQIWSLVVIYRSKLVSNEKIRKLSGLKHQFQSILMSLML